MGTSINAQWRRYILSELLGQPGRSVLEAKASEFKNDFGHSIHDVFS